MNYVCAGNPLHIKESNRQPKGWHEHNGEYFCKSCWDARFVLRAIVFPLAGLLDKTEWSDFQIAINTAWKDSTRAANAAMTEHAKSERVRMPGDTKLWPAPNKYVYPLIRDMVPGLPSVTIASITNQVQKKYNAIRLDLVWRGAVSLPSFRYPYPMPFPAETWKPRYLSETERVPIVSVPIAGPRRFDLRLRGGSEFKRQLAAFRLLIEGKAKKCEMAIYRVNANKSDKRGGGTPTKKPGGGKSQATRIMVKLVMWLPIAKKAEGDKVMTLSRGQDHFVQARIEGRPDPWTIYADHVRVWITGHARRRQRMADDLKFEKRWPSRNRLQQQQYLELICINHNNRLKSFCHLASKMTAEFAYRQKCNTVIYDATPTEYLPDFPWFQFKMQLEYKLKERGISLVIEGEDESEPKEQTETEAAPTAE